jgi:hypothetical protein
MNTTTRSASRPVALLLAVALAGGVSLTALPAAPARAIDSISDLCASLPHDSQGYRDCVETRVVAQRPSEEELKCYRGAGVAVGALLVDNYLSKGNAQVLAARLIAAGAFGCIGSLFV